MQKPDTLKHLCGQAEDMWVGRCPSHRTRHPSIIKWNNWRALYHHLVKDWIKFHQLGKMKVWVWTWSKHVFTNLTSMPDWGSFGYHTDIWYTSKFLGRGNSILGQSDKLVWLMSPQHAFDLEAIIPQLISLTMSGKLKISKGCRTWWPKTEMKAFKLDEAIKAYDKPIKLRWSFKGTKRL